MSTRVKEAIKTALAMVLVYGIALSVGWMNPYWAGWAVAMVSLSTAGESLRKGVLRLAGTVPGCAAALAILALAPQSRWTFIALVAGWIFLTSYMMNTDTKRGYFWQVAGFVCPIIVITGPSSSEVAFQHAVFRTVETAMGVTVYMLVSVLIWPRTNAGAARRAGKELVAAQAMLVDSIRRAMIHGAEVEGLAKQYRDQAARLAAVEHAVQSEGSERVEVFARRAEWRRFEALCREQLRVLARMHTGAAAKGDIDLVAVVPDLPRFLTEIDDRLTTLVQLFEGVDSVSPQTSVTLRADRDALRSMTTFERATVAVTLRELRELDSLSLSTLTCATRLTRRERATDVGAEARQRAPTSVILDRDHLRGATFAAASVFVGFLIWIYLDPPGHAGWFMIAGSLGLAVAGTQQLKTTVFVKPLLVALPLGMCVYALVLPKLSSFIGLGLLIFAAMFVIRYFFTGLASLCGTIALLQGFVTNQQTYDFAAVANSSLFTVMAFGFLFVMSYLLRSPRPEKAVLALVHRFFRSAEKLVAHSAEAQEGRTSWLDRYRAAYWAHDLETLPSKLEAWGRAISPDLYPTTNQEQIQELVLSLRVLALRIEDLVEPGHDGEAHRVADEIRDEVDAWRSATMNALSELAAQPNARAKKDAWQRFEGWLDQVDDQAARAVARLKEGLTETDAESFYRLLGGFRGVSDALAVYAGAAAAVQWNEWREERFS